MRDSKTRSRRMPLTLLLVLGLLASLLALPASAEGSKTTWWVGHGAGSIRPCTPEDDGPFMHWILTPGGPFTNSNGMLYIETADGTTPVVGQTMSGGEQGALHFLLNDYIDPEDILAAPPEDGTTTRATYDSAQRSGRPGATQNAILTLSEACYPAPSTMLTLTAPAEEGANPSADGPFELIDGVYVTYAGTEVSITVTEKNDGHVDLANPYVAFEFDPDITCDGGSNAFSGPATLAPGAEFDATCTFTVPDDVNEIALVITGHGMWEGYDVTWIEGCEATGEIVEGTGSAPDVWCDADEILELDFEILSPSTSLYLGLDDSEPPLKIKSRTYTLPADGGTVVVEFFEENDSADVPLTDVSLSSEFADCDPEPIVDADGFNVGDIDQDDVLDPGEIWEFECTIETEDPVDLFRVTATGTDALGSKITWDESCEEGFEGGPAAGIFCDADEYVDIRIVLETEGDEGCTPGYWRQFDHRLGVQNAWSAAGVEPDDLFSLYFDDAFPTPAPGLEMGEVVWLGGGGLNALGRHTVAAYLNALTVDYAYSPTEVQDMFNAAFASGEYEATKNLFDTANNAGCPLNASGR